MNEIRWIFSIPNNNDEIIIIVIDIFSKKKIWKYSFLDIV